MIGDHHDILFHLLQSPCLILSQTWLITDANTAALTLYRWEKHQIIGAHCFSLLGHSLSQRHLDALAADGYASVEIDTQVQQQVITTRWSIHRVHQDQRDYLYLLGEDITTIRRLEESVYQLNDIIRQLPGNVYWYDKNFY